MSLAYYQYLVRTVPPTRLAEVALARMWRQLPRLQPLPSPPSARALLRSLGASRVDELPTRVAAPIAGPLAFASPAGARAAARLLRSALPQEAERALHEAHRALDGEIEVFGQRHPIPRRDREVPAASPTWQAIDWEQDPAGPYRFDGGSIPEGADPKNPWVLGRLDEVVHLALGALLVEPTDPSTAARMVHAALDRMVDFASAPMGIQWAMPMEVALRAANLATALRLLAGQAVCEERAPAILEILRSLAFHAAWVDDNWEDRVAVPNNHLVSNLVGVLWVGALFPGLRLVQAPALRALTRLERELFAQTLPDGMSFEGSVPYHRLAVELFTLGLLGAQTRGSPPSAAASERLQRMYGALRELLDGRGEAPQIGDCDSGRAFPFRRRGSREIGWLLPLGASLFGAPALNLGEPGPELVWLLGEPGLRRWERLGGGRPPRDSALRHAGIYVMRSSRMSCAIACGPNGTGGTGSHGHNDKLAIELCVDGQRVVIDPGSGRYTSDPALRNALRGTASHSTVRVDGKEQQTLYEDRLFALPEEARARALLFETGERQARFVGEHVGYRRLEEPALHRRSLTLHKGDEHLEIHDLLLGRGIHRAELRYFVPWRPVMARPTTEDERKAYGAAYGHAVELGGVALLLLDGEPRMEEALHAVGYGELRVGTLIVVERTQALPLVFRSSFLALRQVSGGAGEGR